MGLLMRRHRVHIYPNHAPKEVVVETPAAPEPEQQSDSAAQEQPKKKKKE